jgi:hypothetical protein
MRTKSDLFPEPELGATIEGGLLGYAVYLLYWYKSTCFEPELGATIEGGLVGYAVYLLYWYKSTCFTGTKVLALSLRRVRPSKAASLVRSLLALLA